MGTLQTLVNRLGQDLGRPVLVDDTRLRPLAYSPHQPDDMDRVRSASILERCTSHEVSARLQATGIPLATQPLRIVDQPDLGMERRVCVPVTRGSRLLGYTWVIDAPLELDQRGLERLRRFADDAADAIVMDGGIGWEHVQARRLVSDLLSSPPRDACDVAAEVVQRGLLVRDGPTVTLVARREDDEALREEDRVPLAMAVRRFASGLPSGQTIQLTMDDLGICLVGGFSVEQLRTACEGHGAALMQSLREAMPATGFVVGCGEPVPSLALVGRSYRQALHAANVRALLGGGAPVQRWADLGVYRLFAALPEDLRRDGLPAGLLALLDRPNGQMLIETLEIYLETGGDAKATAQRLFLARGSLYYRLSRIEEIAEVDLRSGEARLTLHMGLKLGRLGGMLPRSAPASAA